MHVTKRNFVKIDASIAEILRFFKMATAVILNFLNCEILLACKVAGASHITVPNFIKISQSVVEILQFFYFSRWRPYAILDLFGTQLDHHIEYSMVSIIVQNSVMINAVVLII